MCNCCNGVGHEFEARNMKCKILIRGNIMSVYLPFNATDIAVKVCPLCGRILETSENSESSEPHTGFVEYQAPDERYEVRGIMPKSLENEKKEEGL